jgi:hypothetical protein
MGEEILIWMDKNRIRVNCPHYNINIYSLEINRVCSAEFPENKACMAIELMIEEIMKEKEIIKEKSKLLSK